MRKTATKSSAPPDLRHIRGIVWDLDNTLYRFDAAMIEAFHVSMARAALDNGLVMDLHTAVDIARRSFAEHGQSGRIFTRDYGISFAAIHHGFHHHIAEKVIAACHDTRAQFERLDLTHALITHASKEWSRRVLQHIGLDPWFPEDRVFGLECHDFKRKDDSRIPFESALKILGLKAAETMMVEDTLQKLRIPHEMGMTTAFLHHGREPENMPEFVLASCANTPELLALLASWSTK